MNFIGRLSHDLLMIFRNIYIEDSLFIIYLREREPFYYLFVHKLRSCTYSQVWWKMFIIPLFGLLNGGRRNFEIGTNMATLTSYPRAQYRVIFLITSSYGI